MRTENLKEAPGHKRRQTIHKTQIYSGPPQRQTSTKVDTPDCVPCQSCNKTLQRRNGQTVSEPETVNT